LGAGKADDPFGDTKPRSPLAIEAITMTPGTLSHQEQGRPPKKARRIAGSSSGHTARGRGFRT
jgi:hypothetical protein